MLRRIFRYFFPTKRKRVLGDDGVDYRNSPGVDEVASRPTEDFIKDYKRDPW